MKRWIAIGAAVVALAAAGWGLFWWTGRGEVERALDAGVARLAEQGWTVSWQDQDLGGFPFGYSVRLAGLSVEDDGGGSVVSLPWASAETEGTDRVVIRMPETFAVSLPVPGVARAADAEIPAVVEVTGETRDLVLSLSADGGVEATADRVSWTVDQPEIGRRLTQVLEGLTATFVPNQPEGRYRMRADRLVATAEAAEQEGPPSTAVVTANDVVAEGSSAVGSAEALGEMLYAGAPGQAQGSLATGAVEMRVDAAGPAPGTFEWRADATRAGAALTSGRMELDVETSGNGWTLDSSDPSVAVRGRLSAGLARALYAVPMAPAEQADEMAIRLAVADIAAADEVWEQVDPEGILPRTPGSLIVDLTGMARVTERIDRLRPGSPPPFEVTEILFREISAEALGATLRATGEVEILQPVGVPLGEVQVGITGLQAMVDALARAGILAPEMVLAAKAIMSVYLRPAAAEDAWTAEIAFTREGPLVNGLPVR